MGAIGDSDHNLMLGIPLVMAIVVEDSSWPISCWDDNKVSHTMTMGFPYCSKSIHSDSSHDIPIVAPFLLVKPPLQVVDLCISAGQNRVSPAFFTHAPGGDFAHHRRVRLPLPLLDLPQRTAAPCRCRDVGCDQRAQKLS